MTEAELLFQYGWWGELAGHSVSDWQYEVAGGDTRLGYWAWVAARIENDVLQEEPDA